ncbi:DUF1772 domain-containing protein [Dyadobacter sp. CY356]|uniref:DUF1772 domain-containing protein n=1 Tax=Dyadobacter sp. CY356 TaxID=2906442 RepID=UPI001F390DBA|nr:DUF1772 domain-containing protein [Dyadobacter sp. CY356]MCF0059119.1 DUF1772 domain-containing protein [Dyadobacter sp. CY356]
MNTAIISQILLTIAILSTGVIYGTDMFHAVVVRKATALSKDSSLIDLIGHTHLVADKRMPAFGITSIVTTLICAIINFVNVYTLGLLCAALFMLLSHLNIYMNVAKPVNQMMSEAAVKNSYPDNIRALQIRWESVINYRAAFLTAAMLLLILSVIICGN